jgi:hypothetical protein
MQSTLPSKARLTAAFIGVPDNDNSRLPRSLARDGWWLVPEIEIHSPTTKNGVRRDRCRS